MEMVESAVSMVVFLALGADAARFSKRTCVGLQPTVSNRKGIECQTL